MKRKLYTLKRVVLYLLRKVTGFSGLYWQAKIPWLRFSKWEEHKSKWDQRRVS